jgi:hypothetical protein
MMACCLADLGHSHLRCSVTTWTDISEVGASIKGTMHSSMCLGTVDYLSALLPQDVVNTPRVDPLYSVKQ